MRETAPVVRSQNSVLRGIVPIYSIGSFVFATVVVVGIYLMMLRLDPRTATVVAVGSLLGIAAVGSLAKPSWMLVATNQVGRLEGLLAEYRYSEDRRGEWVPPLPRWLRWGYNRVGIRRQHGTVLVTGPATVLRDLALDLKCES